MYVKHNIEARSRCQGKAVSITYSECDSVALVIQHAMRIPRIMSISVTFLAPPYFAHYLIKDKIFRKRDTGHKLCVLIFFENFVSQISFSEHLSHRHRFSCKAPDILVGFKKLGISRQIFRKNISNLTEIRSVGADSFHADGRTHIIKLIVAFRLKKVV